MRSPAALLFAASCAAFASALGGIVFCAGEAAFFKPGPKEPLYGKWVNTAYRGSGPSSAQKLVFHHWGYCETYNRTGDGSPSSRATFTLVDKWVDARGFTWYREFRRDVDARASRIVFYLDRIDGTGSVLESVCAFGDFPHEEDLDPRNPRYRVMYRPAQSR